jgi:hypothetical protein
MKSQPVTHKSPSDAPPGTRQHAAAKGAPINAPTVLPPGFIDGSPKGGQYITARHGIQAPGLRSKSPR